MFFDNTTAPTAADGGALYSHGGHILRHGGYYYLYGEDRRDGLKVSVYRSQDLRQWEYRGTALSIDSPVISYPLTRTDRRLKNPEADAGKRCNFGVTIERPKVIYNPGTRKFVMWMHFEDGRDYKCAHAAVASCDAPDGEFTYHGSFRPCGEMSRDCTLFVDDDGAAYFISASRDNADLHIYRLTPDYMAIDAMVAKLFPQQFREAPALFKRNGIYFMLSSECTGWEPNQGRYSWAHSIAGPWAPQRPFGSPTTYNTQPAFVLQLPGPDGDRFFYVGDRWDPREYFNSRYIVLPLRFTGDTELEMPWCDTLEYEAATGALRMNAAEPDLFRLTSRHTLDCLNTPEGAAPGSHLTSARLAYGDAAMRFRAERTEGGLLRIISADCGLALCAAGDGVALAKRDEADPGQLWTAEAQPEGITLLLAQDGRALTMRGGQHSGCEPALAERECVFDTAWGHCPQGWLITPLYGE